MKEEKTESEITIEMGERGFRRVLIGADDAKDLAAAHLLLSRVAPELQALDRALRETARNNGGVL